MARDPEPSNAFPDPGERMAELAMTGLIAGCSAFRLILPSALNWEAARARREIAGDWSWSLWTMVRAREFVG